MIKNSTIIACETISANSNVSRLGGEDGNAMFIKSLEGNFIVFNI